MSMVNPYQQYQKQSILTAAPGELTLALYNGCIKFIKKSMIAIENGNVTAAHENNCKAQNIILELMATLNMDYDVSHQLLPLYDFIISRLVEGNVKKDTAILQEALDLITDIRDTWEQAMKIIRSRSLPNR